MQGSRKRKHSPVSDDVKKYPNSSLSRQPLQNTNLVASVEQLKYFYSFDKIIRDGKCDRISEPIFVGMLLSKHIDIGRYLFKFDCNGTIFEAFATKKNEDSRKTFNGLQTGFSYMLQGNLRACERKLRYSSASDCEARLMLNIYQLTNHKFADTRQQFCQLEKATLKTLNAKIQRGEKFTQEVEGVYIVAGFVQRYKGCNKCSYGLQAKDKHGNVYCCYMCKEAGLAEFDKRTRVACVNIWDLKLQDDEGTILKGGILHHHQVALLFGDEAIQQARKVFSDNDVTIIQTLRTLEGVKFSCTVKHAEATQDKDRERGSFKLTIENLVKTDRSAQQTQVDSRGFENDVFSRNLNEVTKKVSKASLKSDFSPGSSNEYRLRRTTEGHIGLALIVNIMFDGKDKRLGSEKDVETLEQLFPELGVKVFKGKALQDVGREEFLKALREFKEELVNENYSSSFVVLMSHGELLHMQLANDDEIHVYEDVFNEFGEDTFPEFDGMPKIFIFHGCQNYPSRETNHPPEVINQTQVHPDCLLCFPSRPGTEALRDTETGAYFIQIMADVLRTERNYAHLVDLMNIVQKRVSYVVTELPIRNRPMVDASMFDRFYFPLSE